MKYTLVGSLGNINLPLAQKLIKAGNELTIITHHQTRVADIEKLGAKAAVGSVDDVEFLTKAFKGADAVYTMCPPNYAVEDMKKYIHQLGRNLAAAIKASGVKKVVNLSSVGANLSSGTGPVVGLHRVELEFNALDGVDVKHLRPGYFYMNLYGNLGMIKNAGIFGNNFGAQSEIAMVYPTDIAEVAAEELLNLSFSGKSFRYIAGDLRTSAEVASVFGKAIGKPELPYVEFTDEQSTKGMIDAGLPANIAENYTEMGGSIRSGEMMADLKKHYIVQGKIKLEDFAKEFAAAYSSQEGVLSEA